MTDTRATDHQALRLSHEVPATTISGYVMLLVLLLAILAGFVALGMMADAALAGFGILLMIASTLGFVLIVKGFYLLQPNQAAAILLFGS